MRCWRFHLVLVLVVSLLSSSCWILIITTTFSKQSTRATTHPRWRSGDIVAMYLSSREWTVELTAPEVAGKVRTTWPVLTVSLEHPRTLSHVSPEHPCAISTIDASVSLAHPQTWSNVSR
jgi:hypothetical protein